MREDRLKRFLEKELLSGETHDDALAAAALERIVSTPRLPTLSIGQFQPDTLLGRSGRSGSRDLPDRAQADRLTGTLESLLPHRRRRSNRPGSDESIR
jgi:hypothetical protein